MMQNKDTKVKKQSVLSKSVSILLKFATVGISVWLVIGAVNEFVAYRQLKTELTSVEEKLETIKAEHVSLSDEKANLEDPAYVQNYARGTHLLSKSGETVFILPKADE